jgi:hypothetical protein
MNTMVGLQASLHTPTEDSLSDLMKNDEDFGAALDTFDDNGELNDDFDPGELLQSPLFNDSAEKLSNSFSNENEFGQFGVEEEHDTLLGNRSQPPMPAHQQGFGGGMGYSEPVKRAPPARPAMVRENPSLTPKMQMMTPMQSIDTRMGLPSLQSSFTSSASSARHNPIPSVIGGSGMMMDTTPPMIGASVTDDNSHYDHNEMQDYGAQSYHSPTSRRAPDRSFSGASSHYSEATHEHISPLKNRMSPAPGYQFQQLQPHQQQPHQQQPHQQQPHQQQTTPHQMVTPRRGLPPKAQSYAPGSHNMGGSPNDLQAMRQQLERMRDMEIRDTLQGSSRRTSDASNLSQSVHLPVQRTASANSSLSRSMHFDQMGNNNFRGNGMPGAPPFGNGNVSIASTGGVQSFKPSFNAGGMDSQSMGGSGGPGTNDAMEKLCLSMKRSAMSRTLVKQYSSGRGVSRNGSGHLNAMRQATGGRQMMDDSSGRSNGPATPVRRLSSAKHRLQHPSRGVYLHDSQNSLGYRHDSQNSLGGTSAHSVNLQFDGRNMGTM